MTLNSPAPDTSLSFQRGFLLDRSASDDPTTNFGPLQDSRSLLFAGPPS
eukprot:CAMPEP_0194286212 /NCGR_PEP_ID=MMETSP0169-20130528/32052_1 /TAXON_ID=218684 /ORGANISM="Corethron pennatum, Strain L29A3" /LENGTH=48 /DNA_ID= /DNA_START= /DNA_END= /DNA_ORIENTATION=